MQKYTKQMNDIEAYLAVKAKQKHVRESASASKMRLHKYADLVAKVGPIRSMLLASLAALALCACALRFLSRSSLLTLFYTALYLTASPAAILINKVIMKDFGFHYPIIVSALGMGTTSVASFLCVRVFKTHPIDQSKPVPVSNLVVLGATTALALCLGQYPYLYLTVAFIQMLKAFSPTYMVIFLALLGVEQPSRRIVLITVGLSAFTALASAGEVNFNLVGVSFMVAASTADAVRLVVAQKLLKNLKLAPMEALYYTSPITLGWMGLAVFTELPDVWRTSAHAIVGSHPVLFCVAGLSGFVINLSGFLLVKRTSGMTLKILTMSRNGGLVLVSAVVFGETITRLEAFGYSGLLVCFALYTFEKMRPEAPPPPHAGDGAGHEDQDVEQRWSLRTPNSPTSSRGGSPDGSPRGPTLGSAWRGGYEAPPATPARVHGVESERESR